ncbi:MAG: DUF5916 domain-containing protein [Acidobacteriota bacterium]
MRALVVLLLLVRAAFAECPAARAPKTLPVARGAVVVDGVLDDATWRTACFADDFEQKMPVFGSKPSHPVKVAVAIDGDTLYVGARMWSGPHGVVDDALTQRDDTSQAERFIVSLDPTHTRRLAYSFAVTAAGVRADWIHTDDSEGRRDLSWDPVWVARTKLLPDGWSAEMAIPLSQLRLPREPAASWGIDFDWYIPYTNEDVFWRAVPPDRTAWASYFGELTELPPIRPGWGLELLPYLAGRFVVDEATAAPPAKSWLAGLEAGIDAKFHPLPGLVVAATINPDFGQVDQDPAFVNLSAYEVRLPEKRPFFIENNQLFANAGGYYFYSRRIGGLPRGGVLPTADAIDLPPQIRILGAAAAGGYVAPRTQIALLGAVTDETSADALVGGRATSLVISPLTAWAAGRVEQQVNTSVLGATATVVQRALGGTGLSALLPETAFVTGADTRLRTCDQTYELYNYAGLTGIFGSAAAITSVEESSAHLFQRPDQPHVHLDTDAHRLLGWHAGSIASKRAGMWQGTGLVNFASTGYEVNDLGALMSADDIDTSVSVKRLVTTPSEHLFSWDAGGGIDQSWNFGALRKQGDVRAFADATTVGFNSASIAAYYFAPGGSDALTRGGPLMRVGWASALLASASTPYGRAHQLSGNLELDVSPTLQQGVVASASYATRVVRALRLDITPSLSVFETHRQYVATVTDAGGGDATYGARYLFGHLQRREASLQLRATWSLSPDLVITLYAQPFVSVGKYDAIGELAAAGSEDVRWYASTVHAGASRAIDDSGTGFTIAEPDYTVASLRSTAVLKWELRPGSILYVVWQQARGGTASTLAQPLHSAVPDVVTQSAIHTLAVKLSYWFG